MKEWNRFSLPYRGSFRFSGVAQFWHSYLYLLWSTRPALFQIQAPVIKPLLTNTSIIRTPHVKDSWLQPSETRIHIICSSLTQTTDNGNQNFTLLSGSKSFDRRYSNYSTREFGYLTPRTWGIARSLRRNVCWRTSLPGSQVWSELAAKTLSVNKQLLLDNLKKV